MTSRVRIYWRQLRESLWFVPGLMVLTSFGLAYGLVEFDANTSWRGQKNYPLLFGAGAEGARGMLSAIAGSMLTVATLTFTLTISAITQVSSQYSPRVLRNFMNDRSNQVVMGYFVGVFAYCLIVLGTIRGTDETKFVPSTAVLVGLILSLGGVAALIFFIHHITESLQTGTIVQHVFGETSRAIDQLFPVNLGDAVDDPMQIAVARRNVNQPDGWLPVRANNVGYFQQLNTRGLLRWASSQQVVVRMDEQIGAFVETGTAIFSVKADAGSAPKNDSDWPNELLEFVSIGRHRNIEQDAAFGIQQLVDIVLKALSPGINDTTTAIMAIDYLGAIGVRLAQHEFATDLRAYDGNLRVLTCAPDFDAYVRLIFDLSRINAKANHAVFRRLLRALGQMLQAVRSADRQLVLREQARLLLNYADETLSTEYEKKSVRALYNELIQPTSAPSLMN